MKSRPRWRSVWPTFALATRPPLSYRKRIKDRLDAGHETYGDASWLMSRDDAIDEIRAELVDVYGWSLIAWPSLNWRDRITLCAVLRLTKQSLRKLDEIAAR